MKQPKTPILIMKDFSKLEIKEALGGISLKRDMWRKEWIEVRQ